MKEIHHLKGFHELPLTFSELNFLKVPVKYKDSATLLIKFVQISISRLTQLEILSSTGPECNHRIFGEVVNSQGLLTESGFHEQHHPCVFERLKILMAGQTGVNKSQTTAESD